jgi:hypothetical protein
MVAADADERSTMTANADTREMLPKGDRPTPETDALWGESPAPGLPVWDFARRMERERDELRNYLDTAHYATCNRELRAENARLRERLNDAQTNVKALIATVDNVRAESERLRGLVASMQSRIGCGCGGDFGLCNACSAADHEALAGKDGA